MSVIIPLPSLQERAQIDLTKAVVDLRQRVEAAAKRRDFEAVMGLWVEIRQIETTVREIADYAAAWADRLLEDA